MSNKHLIGVINTLETLKRNCNAIIC